MNEDTYKKLFEKQKVIIERMKKDIETIERIQQDIDSQKRKIEEKSQDQLEGSEYGSFFDSDDESIDLDETNMSDNLRLALGLSAKTDICNNLSWTPPSRSGLDNSKPLIQPKNKL